jgi:Protein of unknown function (DUF2752)
MSTKAAAAHEICGRIPPRYGETERRSLLWFVLWSALVIAGAAVLYFFNPAQFGFYPTCMFYKTTGLLCPGCGTLRATHQLLHGHVEAAFRFNALIVSSLPLVAWGCVRAARNRAANQPALAWIRPAWLWLGLVILLLFAILRNLPGASHYWLAP